MQGLPVHATQRACDFLSSNQPWKQLVLDGNIVLRPLAPGGQALQLSPRLAVTAELVPHRGEFSDTVAYHVAGPARRLFYCPDIDRWAAGCGQRRRRRQRSRRRLGVPVQTGDEGRLRRSRSLRRPTRSGCLPARRWEAWERDVRQVVQQAADLSFLDACFYSGDELPGRDMSKIPHPLVTDTLQRLEGLEDR
jgi:pyrroloquinoline quinone biosynthesis protein B